MDYFEQADVFTPSRTAQQEEEELAASTAHQNLDLPVIIWHKRWSQMSSKCCKLLIIATCPTSCAVLRNLPTAQEPVATLLLPGTALQGFRASRSPSEPSCALHASTDGSLMTVCCQVSMPAERARAWSRGLMGQVAAEHVVVLGALAPDALRTEGDPTQETLLYCLSSSASAAVHAAAAQPKGLPLLPPGNVVSGLPAALLSYCQARGQLADALLLVPSDSCGLGWGVQPLLHALPTLLTPSAASGSSADAEAQLRLGLSAPGTAAAALADLRHRGDGPGSRVYA